MSQTCHCPGLVGLGALREVGDNRCKCYGPGVRGLMQGRRGVWPTGRALSPARGGHVEIRAQQCLAFQQPGQLRENGPHSPLQK